MKSARVVKILLLLLLLAWSPETYSSTIHGRVTRADREIEPGNGITLYGTVTDRDGNPLAGVVVTDGYDVVTTDSRGIYRITRDSRAAYVYISVPSGYEIPPCEGFGSYAGFYKPATSATGGEGDPHRVDFRLDKMARDDKDFILFAIGDPQPDNDQAVGFFRDETVPDVLETVSAYGKPAVAVALGDIVGKNKEGTRFRSMKEVMGSSGLPFFVTIGNHDKSEGGGDLGEKFSGEFGPLWYSFNRGDAHFVCLDVIEFGQAGVTSDYKLGISDEQIMWLEKDLSYVPEDRLLVVYYHIPIKNRTGADYRNTGRLMDMLGRYPNLIALSGHTHRTEMNPNTKYSHEEHVVGAACGYFWRSRACNDGTPQGYAVYEISGNRIVNARFKATGRDAGYQIRMYRGDASFGGDNATYAYDLGPDHVVANVFFAGAGGDWTIQVYEDGILSGEMEPMPASYGDRWAWGYHIGVRGHSVRSAGVTCSHQYSYRLKNPASAVTVKAVDPYGNEYFQDRFTESNDFSEIIR